MRDSDVERDEIDGVSVFWGATPGRLEAVLLFRVGFADETLARLGTSHLVEHLALFPIGQTPYAYNGGVEDLFTVFWARGTPKEIVEFLSTVCANLGELPLHRLEAERRILAAESEASSNGVGARLFSMRYGAQRHGLGTYLEFGLRSLDASDLEKWSQERFNNQNAALWLSGPPPAELGLELADGVRQEPPAPTPLADIRFPAYLAEGRGGVAATMTGQRATALNTVASIVTDRLHDRVRRDLGLAYGAYGGYVPLTAETAHLTVGIESSERDAPAMLDEMMATIDELCEQGPTDAELDRARELAGRAVAEEYYLLSALDSYARDHLFGAQSPTTEQIQHERDALQAGALPVGVDRLGRVF